MPNACRGYKIFYLLCHLYHVRTLWQNIIIQSCMNQLHVYPICYILQWLFYVEFHWDLMPDIYIIIQLTDLLYNISLSIGGTALVLLFCNRQRLSNASSTTNHSNSNNVCSISQSWYPLYCAKWCQSVTESVSVLIIVTVCSIIGVDMTIGYLWTADYRLMYKYDFLLYSIHFCSRYYCSFLLPWVLLLFIKFL